jgi:hypothetical protein
MIRWVGAGAGADIKILLAVENAITSAGPTGTNYTIGVHSATAPSAGTATGNFLAGKFQGRGMPAMELSVVANAASEYQPALKCQYQTKPASNAHLDGGIINLHNVPAQVVGQIDSGIYIGAKNRDVYDRVVVSGDPGAAHAWARFTTGSPALITMHSKYGISSISNSGTFISVNLYTRADGEGVTNADDMCAIATAFGVNAESTGKVCTVSFTSPTLLIVKVYNTSNNTPVNTETTVLGISLIVFANVHEPSADRPTFFKPLIDVSP